MKNLRLEIIFGLTFFMSTNFGVATATELACAVRPVFPTNEKVTKRINYPTDELSNISIEDFKLSFQHKSDFNLISGQLMETQNRKRLIPIDYDEFKIDIGTTSRPNYRLIVRPSVEFRAAGLRMESLDYTEKHEERDRLRLTLSLNSVDANGEDKIIAFTEKTSDEVITPLMLKESLGRVFYRGYQQLINPEVIRAILDSQDLKHLLPVSPLKELAIKAVNSNLLSPTTPLYFDIFCLTSKEKSRSESFFKFVRNRCEKSGNVGRLKIDVERPNWWWSKEPKGCEKFPELNEEIISSLSILERQEAQDCLDWKKASQKEFVDWKKDGFKMGEW